MGVEWFEHALYLSKNENLTREQRDFVKNIHKRAIITVNYIKQ